MNTSDVLQVLSQRGVVFAIEAVFAVSLGVAVAMVLVSPWRASHEATMAGGGVAFASSEPSISVDTTILMRLDPFHRQAVDGAQAAPVVVEAVDTSLNLTLTGVNANEADPLRGAAIIRTPDNLERRFTVGDEVLPGVRLREVQQLRVLLDRSDGSVEALPFKERESTLLRVDPQASATPLRQGRLRLIEETAASPSSGPQAAQVETVTDAPVANEPANGAPTLEVEPAELLANLRSQPATLDDGRRGLALYPAGDPGVFSRAGLIPGDVLLSANSYRITGMEDALTALSTLQNERSVVFVVHRNGADITINTAGGE